MKNEKLYHLIKTHLNLQITGPEDGIPEQPHSLLGISINKRLTTILLRSIRMKQFKLAFIIQPLTSTCGP